MYVRTYGDAKSAIGIAIDAEGYSFVSENSGLCLSIFDPHKEARSMHTIGNLTNPWRTALDPRDGSVYVAVLKY